MLLFPSYRGCSVTAIFTLKPVWGAEDFLDSVGSACLSLWTPRKNKPGNGKPVSHIQLPGWFKAKRPDGKHGDRPKYSCLISQRFRRQVVMKTFPWGCSTRNWGYNQYKIGDIHRKLAVSYLCFDGDRESGSKLLSSLILLNMIGDFPNRKSTACGIYRNMLFSYLLGFLTQIQVVVSRVCHAPGLVMPNDCYFSTGVKAPIPWLNHALGEK